MLRSKMLAEREEVVHYKLVELKLQLEHLRKKLQSSKSTDMCAEDDFYREYVRIKQKIAEIENPF